VGARAWPQTERKADGDRRRDGDIGDRYIIEGRRKRKRERE
jgi:hypothetical protein